MKKREKFRFERLEVYKRAFKLALHVFSLTRKWPKEYLYDLTAQIRRAVLSIFLNIAEGSGRSKREFGRYLDIARGSCKECVALINFAYELGLTKEEETETLLNELSEISMMLSGLKKSLK